MGRVCFSRVESQGKWSRWREGRSLSDIARTTSRHVGSVHGLLSRHGGIAPRQPVTSAHALSTEERESISRGLAANESLRSIARAIGRAPSTVSREVHRHGGRAHYRAVEAANAAARAPRPAKPLVLSTNGLRRQIVDNTSATGHPSRSRAGFGATTPTSPRCMCPMRRSTCRSTCATGARYRSNSFNGSGHDGSCVARNAPPLPVNVEVRSSVPCQSPNARRRSRRAERPDTGKETSSRVRRTPTSQRWSSVGHGGRCSCSSPVRTLNRLRRRW